MHIIDAHIHLDMYENKNRQRILTELEAEKIAMLISVSNDYQSAAKTLQIAMDDHRIKPTFGYHPEQPLPSMVEMDQFFTWIEQNKEKMIAIGEVGLPYYLRKENEQIELTPYIQLLTRFIELSVRMDKPIILHAVYEDAPLVCTLLEEFSVKKAHFHWFKGDQKTLERIIQQNYVISVTPDVCYKRKIQQIVAQTPIENLLVETDGPWPFEGPFRGEMTHPKMLHASIEMIASIKDLALDAVYEQLYKNTVDFYCLDKR